MNQPHRAVIFVPNSTDHQASAHCLDHIAAQGWVFAGVVPGDWRAAWEMACKQHADFIVVDQRHDLPPDRVPRVVIVAEELRGPDLCGEVERRPVRGRRPRPI